MSTLMQIALDAQDLERKILESGGELTPELEQSLTVNETTLALKVDAYDVIINRLEKSAELWKAEAESRTKIARAMARAADRLRETLKVAMTTMNVTEVRGVDTRFYFQNAAPKLVIEDAQKLPEEFILTTVVKEPIKDAIVSALKMGKEISGAKLEPVKSLRVGRYK